MSDRRLELAGLLAVTTIVAVVLLTRNPDGAVVERAKRWPLVGPLAARLQERFRDPPPPRPAPPSRPREVVVLHWTIPAPPEASVPRPSARRAPSGAAAIDRAPEPPGPLEAEAARPEQRERALARLGAEARATLVGPYELVAEFDPPERWGRLADELDGAFVTRFGLAPVGSPRESVVVYRDAAAYHSLQALEPRLAGLEATGHAGGGLAAFVAERPESAQAEATLVHELSHFVARRAIGPALPPWLAEGLAEDLAWTPYDEVTGFRWGALRDGIRREGDRVSITGAQAGLEELARAAAAGEAPRFAELAELGDREFAAGRAAPLRYAAALWWVRFLLDGADGARADSLRRFLAEVAAGGPADPAALEQALGEPLAALEPELHAFLAERRAAEIDARLAELTGPDERIVRAGDPAAAPP